MKVTLLGDSIRLMGYGPLVPDYLGEDFEVYQPEENSRFAKHTFRGLYDFRNEMAGSRIVHWNNGHWDACDLFGDGAFTDEDTYVKDMLRLADLLLTRYEKVIFATTTPVSCDNEIFSNDRILRYNNLIVPLLKEKGIIINDLYELLAPDMNTYIRDDDHVHLTEEGSKLCANQVATCIRQAALALEEKDNVSDSGTTNQYEWYYGKTE